MDICELRNGMLITHNGEVARVEKVKQKRLIVQHSDGRRYDTWPVHCSPAPAGAVFEMKVEEAKGVTLGTVVRFKGTARDGMYAVIGLQAGGTYKLAHLFGEDGNRYFHNVAATSIEVVDRKGLAAWLSYTSA